MSEYDEMVGSMDRRQFAPAEVRTGAVRPSQAPAATMAELIERAEEAVKRAAYARDQSRSCYSMLFGATEVQEDCVYPPSPDGGMNRLLHLLRVTSRLLDDANEALADIGSKLV